MGASNSTPQPPPTPESDPLAAPIVLPARAHGVTVGNSRDREVLKEMIADAKPHRCGSRFDDFAMSIFQLNLSNTPNRFGLFWKCYRSEEGQEPRAPHTNIPVARLPKWDPRHPQYDPEAPYDSFPKALRLSKSY